ncbi:MAG: hypothetical protein KDC26_10325 [Armatimonadetes bacterium]|nr:hypothetical protein [Armatimonadota bacterium]
MKKLILPAIAVLILSVVGTIAYQYFTRPSDRILIQESLDETIMAAKEGRPSPVLDGLSKKFTFGDESPLRMDISKVVREAKPDIVVLNPEPTITGDEATIISDVTVKGNYMTMPIGSTFTDVKIVFKRETSNRYLVVPWSKWRIISVEAQNLPSY